MRLLVLAESLGELTRLPVLPLALPQPLLRGDEQLMLGGGEVTRLGDQHGGGGAGGDTPKNLSGKW